MKYALLLLNGILLEEFALRFIKLKATMDWHRHGKKFLKQQEEWMKVHENFSKSLGGRPSYENGVFN